MIPTTSNFDTYNGASSKSPVVLVNIDGLTNDYCTGDFSGRNTSTQLKLLTSFNTIGQSIDLQGFNTNWPGFEFSVIDQAGEISGLFSSYMAGRQVTAKIGFLEITESDFMTLPLAYIDSVELDSDLVTYKFVCRSKWFQFRRPLFNDIPTRRTELTAALSASGTTATVTDSTSDFTSAGSAAFNNDSTTYLMIGGREIVSYSNQPTGTTFTIARGVFGTLDQDHVSGTTVQEVYRVHGHPAEVLLWLLTTNNGEGSSYDLALADWGLKIADAEIDEIQILNEWEKWKDSDATDDFMDWLIFDRVDDGFSWIKSNLLPMMPGYLFITDRGRIGLRIWDLPVNGVGLATFGEDDIKEDATLSWRENDVITHIEHGRSWNIAGSIHGSISEAENDDTDDLYGERVRAKVYPKTSNTTWNATEATEWWFRYFCKFTNGPAYLDFTSLLQNQIYQVGDELNITHSKLPLMRDGSVGWTTEGVEVLSQELQFSRDGVFTKYQVKNPLAADAAVVMQTASGVEADFDDADISLSGNHAAGTLEAADAYWDTGGISPTATVHAVMVRLQMTMPGTNNGIQTMSFDVMSQAPAGTNTKNETKQITFDTAETVTRTYDLYIIDVTAFTEPARIRVDCYNRSGAAGDDPTGMKMVAAKIWKFDGTITNRTL